MPNLYIKLLIEVINLTNCKREDNYILVSY